jgi:L-ascorbate metabolism protein UlaG (beta-lactamase superfamily)
MAGLVLVLLLLGSCGCAATLARTDAAQFPPPPRDAITFWGHACCYIDVGGFGIVTDPVWDESLFYRDRKVPAPPAANYAAARVVLISHSHDDHLSPETLATFPDSVVILCPAPAARYIQHLRQRVHVMRIGEIYETPAGRIHAVAAHHPGKRFGVNAAADGRALGYVIETPAATLYYSGDTDPFPGFAEVARTYHPDLLMLNVNGHLHALDAVRAVRESDAKRVLSLHHGSYGYLFVDARRQPRDYEQLRAQLGSTLVVLELGASLPLQGLKELPAH